MFWIIFLAPLLGFLLNVSLPKTSKTRSHVIACLAVFTSFLASCFMFTELLSSGPQIHTAFEWINVGPLRVPMEFILDRLSALMLLIITGIGTLIHVYAGGYMSHEETTYRFFAYLNLFVFMMLLLVCGHNMLVMFVGWEGVGLCSYLLIGYWFQETANAKAGMKAFVVNRIGDIGFLVGIFLTYRFFGTLTFTELAEKLHTSLLSGDMIYAIECTTLAFFVGACGKSAQLPLYIWLPDAMAGPTPVSALIHAATMVTAGVYMMARLNAFYFLAPHTLMIVACVGVLTALFAATIAIVQTDIKKVLAYSTVSQLGFMVAACGVGAFDAGVFHLLTHACFKALLFLAAGSVIYAMHHEQDIFKMGGLKKHLPITHFVFLIGVLAIIGFPGFSGFFSKDEILWSLFTFPEIGPYLWAVGVVTAMTTSFYMVRLLCLTFYGHSRVDEHTKKHLHETPAVMWLPLVVLAFLSAFIGYLGVPGFLAEMVGIPQFFANYLEPVLEIPKQAREFWEFKNHHHSFATEISVMAISVGLVFASAGFAIVAYGKGVTALSVSLKNRFWAIHHVLLNKYFVDEGLVYAVVSPLWDMSCFLWAIVDVLVINGFINAVSKFFMMMSGLVSFRMSGLIHRYALVFALSVVFLTIVVLS